MPVILSIAIVILSRLHEVLARLGNRLFKPITAALAQYRAAWELRVEGTKLNATLERTAKAQRTVEVWKEEL